MSVTNGNVLWGLSSALVDLPEQVNELVRGKSLRIEQITSLGHRSPDGFWYDQAEDEFVLLVAGAAQLLIEGQPLRHLTKGDWVHLPAHVKHRVEWTDPHTPTVWLAVFWT
jgi:cupin 2 domain-containing protein